MLARLPVRYWGSQEHEGPLTSPGAAVVVRDFSGISGACGCGSGSVSISGCEDATSVDEGAVASVGEGDVDVIDVDADSVVVVMGGVRVNSPGDDTGDDGGDEVGAGTLSLRGSPGNDATGADGQVGGRVDEGVAGDGGMQVEVGPGIGDGE